MSELMSEISMLPLTLSQCCDADAFLAGHGWVPTRTHEARRFFERDGLRAYVEGPEKQVREVCVSIWARDFDDSNDDEAVERAASMAFEQTVISLEAALRPRAFEQMSAEPLEQDGTEIARAAWRGEVEVAVAAEIFDREHPAVVSVWVRVPSG